MGTTSITIELSTLQWLYFSLGILAVLAGLCWTTIRIITWIREQRSLTPDEIDERREQRQAVRKVKELVAAADRAKESHIHFPTAETGPAIKGFADQIKNFVCHNPSFNKLVWHAVKAYAGGLLDPRDRDLSRQRKEVMEQMELLLDSRFK